MYFVRRKLGEISVMSDTAWEVANWRAAGESRVFPQERSKIFQRQTNSCNKGNRTNLSSKLLDR